MNYRISAAPGTPQAKTLEFLADLLRSHPEALALTARLAGWLEAKELAGTAPGVAGEELPCHCT
jgi:hypothetical protein